jgi:hypothetical protein
VVCIVNAGITVQRFGVRGSGLSTAAGLKSNPAARRAASLKGKESSLGPNPDKPELN